MWGLLLQRCIVACIRTQQWQRTVWSLLYLPMRPPRFWTVPGEGRWDCVWSALDLGLRSCIHLSNRVLLSHCHREKYFQIWTFLFFKGGIMDCTRKKTFLKVNMLDFKVDMIYGLLLSMIFLLLKLALVYRTCSLQLVSVMDQWSGFLNFVNPTLTNF